MKVTHRKEITRIDGDGVAETEVETRYVTVGGADKFVKVYFGDLWERLGVAGATSTRLFLFLVSDGHISYGRNQVLMTDSLRTLICEKLGVSVGAVHSAVSKLTRESIFIKDGRGSYVMNRKYVEYGKPKGSGTKISSRLGEGDTGEEGVVGFASDGGGAVPVFGSGAEGE